MKAFLYIEVPYWNPRTRVWEKRKKLNRKALLDSWKEYKHRNAELSNLKESAPPVSSIAPAPRPPRPEFHPKVGKGLARRQASTNANSGGVR